MPRADYIAITSSPLYRLGTKRDLATLLGVELSELNQLVSDELYEEWTKKAAGKKDRIIEQPKRELAAVLARLQSVLSRVETPPWLMSGKKRTTPQDNAAIHAANSYAITVDIAQFYQSTKREYVYSAFKNLFGHTEDVASILASLVTYKGHIPTGTAPSQLVAFWAYKQTLARIQRLASLKGITMSLWVDDIIFSSPKPFPKNWVRDVQKIALEVGLSLKTNKTRYYSAKDHKSYTGTAVTPDGRMTVKNEKRKEIMDLVAGCRVESLNLKEARSLFGKLSAQRRNEPAFCEGMHSRLQPHLRQLERDKLAQKKKRRVGKR